MESFRILLLIFLVLCALFVSFSKNLLVSVVIFMSYSLVMSIIWVLLESPDLAITEAAVGAGVTSVLFFITLKRISAIGKAHKDEQDEITREINARTGVRRFDRYYKGVAVVLGVAIIFALLLNASNTPAFGKADNPYNNEVSERYLEKAIEETGAVNAVAGMILDYRAFDTFGESCVLFIAAACVLVLLRDDKRDAAESATKDERFEPVSDTILQASAKILFPAIMIFGIYILVNGHLSPGGGFSGGAIMGAGLILHVNALDIKRHRSFLSKKPIRSLRYRHLAFTVLQKAIPSLRERIIFLAESHWEIRGILSAAV